MRTGTAILLLGFSCIALYLYRDHQEQGRERIRHEIEQVCGDSTNYNACRIEVEALAR